jgi:hypothetical protein
MSFLELMALLVYSAFVGFDFLTSVVMKSTVLWDITLCIPFKIKGLHGVLSQRIVLLFCICS